GLGTGIPTPVTPEMERVKRNQENISSVLYKEGLGIGTPVPVTPEMERVKRNQENFSSVLFLQSRTFPFDLFKNNFNTPKTLLVPYNQLTQRPISSSLVLYKEDLGTGTPIPVTPEVERVKRNQEHISSVFCGGKDVFPLTPLKLNFLTFIKNGTIPLLTSI
uniref:Uncharacterized protein n=1 Tax=Anas platyrhynchos platyrhynchos TaxID=8840 RepID=A0A493U3V2_ANAPP